MKAYKKNKSITFEGAKYICDAWDIAGYINSRGVNIERIATKNGIDSEGYLLRFNHYEKGENGKRMIMSDSDYNAIVDNFDTYDELYTWTMPFLNFINR